MEFGYSVLKISTIFVFQILFMFSFFQKKNYLVDNFHGLVDIHNHILPGIDDGAKTVEDSIELIREFQQFGVNNFVCTPHIMHNYYDNTEQTIKNSFSLLQAELVKQQVDNVSIDFSAEHMIDDNFEEILANDAVLPLKKYHLLVEMSFLQRPLNFDRAIQNVASAGYFPILAHPERYLFLHSKFGKYEKFRKQGILFQANILSFGGYYGTEVKRVVHKLLDNQMIDFIGSDVHRMEHLKYLKEITLPSKVLAKLEPVICETIEAFL